VWVWGGLVVNSATLGCFFMLHYILPFVVGAVVVIHLLFLHEVGRTNRCGGRDRELKVKLFPFLVVKDCVNLAW
jgi:ubiquinol-cytochrome c reductase cytochrome b subunit